MPTNRADIASLSTRTPFAQAASVGELNEQIAAPLDGLVNGPLLPRSNLTIAPETPLIVTSGRELVVVVAGRLRELLPPGSYDTVSWGRQPGVELHVVDTRIRTLLVSTVEEIVLRYPLDGGSDYLQPFQLDVSLEFRVHAVQRVALDAATPLLHLHDAACDELRRLLHGVPVERCPDLVRQLPERLRAEHKLERIGFEVYAAHLVSMPAPSQMPAVVVSRQDHESSAERIEREMAQLAEHGIPCYPHQAQGGHLLHIPLFSSDERQMSIFVLCPLNYPSVPPQVFVELDKQEQPGYAPRLLSEWKADYTLLTIVQSVTDDF